MNFYYPQETIAALATASGEAGVAIVRVSGPLVPKILQELFCRATSKNKEKTEGVNDWHSHRLYYGRLIDHENKLLDECLAVWMKAPHSFTGEEILEFHLHGGKLISLKVLQAIYQLGVRPAQPGEFSQRAFLNGKIDLMQAEAIADMIAAKSERSLQLAQNQWQGALSGPVQELKKNLMELLVNLEAAVDFPEEDIEIINLEVTEKLIKESIDQLQQWLKDYELGKILRDGLIVVLVGKPNVGKSSLLNLLAREDAAIVHNEPGTTRDAIERTINLGGISIRLVDTAGMRENADFVEQKGIEKSRQWFERGDLVIALLDISSPFEKEDQEILALLKDKKHLVVLNKIDLPAVWNQEKFAKESLVKISTKTSEGLKELESAILTQFKIEDLEKENHLLLNQLRHKQAIEKSLVALESALQALQNRYSPEFVAADIQATVRYLGEIIGEVSTEDILGEIFGRFCIGK